ncbi:MAG TPA: shikimate kinase [Fimbriiglobus sp.]|nr:shikimate kinase [Fimbriiglobus sp.]
MPPPPRLFLVGYRGTGKSTVGPLLATVLRWQFLDADDRIEAAAGKSIADIFAAEGEAGFRDWESAVLAELCRQDRRVIATGGGVVLRPANRELLSTAGYVAWLTASPKAVWQRMQSDPTTAARRPNLTTGGHAEVANLMAARESLYRQTAHGTFPTEGRSPGDVAAAILAAWEATADPSSSPLPPG